MLPAAAIYYIAYAGKRIVDVAERVGKRRRSRLGNLGKAARSHRPVLSQAGRIESFVLEQMDGSLARVYQRLRRNESRKKTGLAKRRFLLAPSVICHCLPLVTVAGGNRVRTDRCAHAISGGKGNRMFAGQKELSKDLSRFRRMIGESDSLGQLRIKPHKQSVQRGRARQDPLRRAGNVR